MSGLLYLRFALPRFLAGAVITLASFLAAMVPVTRASAMTPFVCDGNMYLVRNDATNTTSQMYRIDRSTDPANFNDQVNGPTGLHIGGTPITDSTAYPDGFRLNALAFNPVDRYHYAAQAPGPVAGESPIYRIGSDGEMIQVANLTMPSDTAQQLRGATFGPDGTMYAKTGGHTLAVITGLDAAPATPATVNFVTTSQDIDMGDLAYDMKDNTLFVIEHTAGTLYTLDVTSGALTLVTGAGVNNDILPPSSNYIGSAFFDASNELYVYIHDYDGSTGAFARMDQTNGKITILQRAPIAINTDGSSCVPVEQKIDTVKQAGTVAAENATTFTVPYTLRVGNNSPQSLSNLQVVDNLKLTFSDGNPTRTVSQLAVAAGPCTANTAFNGDTDIRLLSGTDTLDVGQSCTITFSVKLVYPTAEAVPQNVQNNTAYASSAGIQNNGHRYLPDGTVVPPVNVLAVDTSTDTANLPSTPNGDTPSPTPVQLRYQAPPVPPAQLANTGLDEALITSTGIALLVVGAAAVLRVRSRVQ